ncbi:hypothetical protein TWF694_010738 [Orbilia ellipsospora]|uniref:Uncharacterized protein n=1 Tax=Orbilia ellipsospora TaxID=2528407 RepID=A0AAV9X859_9PEZI
MEIVPIEEQSHPVSNQDEPKSPARLKSISPISSPFPLHTLTISAKSLIISNEDELQPIFDLSAHKTLLPESPEARKSIQFPTDINPVHKMVIESLLTTSIDTSGLEESIIHAEDMVENAETTAPEPLSILTAQESGWKSAVIKTGEPHTAKRVYEQEEIWQADNPIRSSDLVYDKKIRLFENYTNDGEEGKSIKNLSRNAEFAPATIVTPRKEYSIEVEESDGDTSMEEAPSPAPNTPATGLRVASRSAFTTLRKTRKMVVIDDIPQTEPRKRVQNFSVDSVLRMTRGRENGTDFTPHRTFDWYDSSSFSPLESSGERAQMAAAKKGGATAKKAAAKQRLAEVEEESEEESEEDNNEEEDEGDYRILPSSSEDEKPKEKKQKKGPAARKNTRKEDSESDFADEQDEDAPKRKTRKATAPKGKAKKGKKKESDYSDTDVEEIDETEAEDTPVKQKPPNATASKVKKTIEEEDNVENEQGEADVDTKVPAEKDPPIEAATRVKRGKKIKRRFEDLEDEEEDSEKKASHKQKTQKIAAPKVKEKNMEKEPDASEIKEEALPRQSRSKSVQKVASVKQQKKKRSRDAVLSGSDERTINNERRDGEEDEEVEEIETKKFLLKAIKKSTEATITQNNHKTKEKGRHDNSHDESEGEGSDQTEELGGETRKPEKQPRVKEKKTAAVRQLLAEKAFELQNKNKHNGVLTVAKYGGFLPSVGKWFGSRKPVPAPPSELLLPKHLSKEVNESNEQIDEEVVEVSFADKEASKTETELSVSNRDGTQECSSSEEDDDAEYYPITGTEIQKLFQDFNRMATKLEEFKKAEKSMEEKAVETNEKIKKLNARLEEQMERAAISQLKLAVVKAIGPDKLDYLYTFSRVERREMGETYDGRQLAKLDVEVLERPPFASKLARNPFHHEDMYQRRQIINNLTFPANVMMAEFRVKYFFRCCNCHTISQTRILFFQDELIWSTCICYACYEHYCCVKCERYTSPANEKEMPPAAQGVEQLNDSKASENYEAWLYTKGIWNDYLKQSEDLKESTKTAENHHQVGSVGLRAAEKRKRDDEAEDDEGESAERPKSKRQRIDERQKELAEMRRRERRPPVTNEDEHIFYQKGGDDEIYHEDDEDIFGNFSGVHRDSEDDYGW